MSAGQHREPLTEADIDEAIAASFPASDPPALSLEIPFEAEPTAPTVTVRQGVGDNASAGLTGNAPR